MLVDNALVLIPRLESWCAKDAEEYYLIWYSVEFHTQIIFWAIGLNFPSRSSSATSLPRKWVPSGKNFLVLSTNYFCIALTENVALRLNSCWFFEWNWRWIDVKFKKKHFNSLGKLHVLEIWLKFTLMPSSQCLLRKILSADIGSEKKLVYLSFFNQNISHWTAKSANIKNSSKLYANRSWNWEKVSGNLKKLFFCVLLVYAQPHELKYKWAR